jgi:hypothetical protein
MMREYHVRICEGLGVKFPGPTRHKRLYPSLNACPKRCDAHYHTFLTRQNGMLDHADAMDFRDPLKKPIVFQIEENVDGPW